MLLCTARATAQSPSCCLAVTWRGDALKAFPRSACRPSFGQVGQESTVRCWCWAAAPCRALGRLR